MIFKAWKSHLKFDALHQVSKRQMHILLKTRLLLIAAASTLYQPLERMLWRKYRRRLSLLKFMAYLAGSPLNLQRVINSAGAGTTTSDKLEKALVKYCCYDKRKKRRNLNEIWESLA